MATYTVSTTAALQARMANGGSGTVGGDIIELSAGTYSTGVVLSNVSKTSAVIIRPANRANPPVFTGDGFQMTNCDHFTFDGIQFIGTTVESVWNGISIPLQDYVIDIDGCENITIINCLFKFQKNQIRVNSGSHNLTIAYNHFTQCGEDCILLGGASNDVTIRFNQFDDHRINMDLLKDGKRHPDVIQARCNPSQVGAGAFQRMLIEYNYFDFDGKSAKAIFLANQSVSGSGVGSPFGQGFKNTTVFQNQVRNGRWCGFNLNGQDNLLYERNWMISNTTTAAEIPRVWIKQAPEDGGPNTNCLIKDNVWPRVPYISEGGKTGTGIVVLTNNTLDTTGTIKPTNFKELIPGLPYASATSTKIGVGPYTSETVTPPVEDAPTQPNVEWSNFPTNTVSGDGRFATYVQVQGLSPDRYTGVLVIPTTSTDMFTAASVGAVAGVEVPNVRWRRSGVTGVGKFKFASPAFNASTGAVRLEMTGSATALADWTVLSGATMSGLTWEWKFNTGTVYSDPSSYSGGFTAPALPPVDPVLTPLQSDEWEILSLQRTVATGRFTYAFRLIPAEAPAGVVAVQWRPITSTTWRTCVADGTSGGATVWRLQPLVVGGLDHTVAYSGENGDTFGFYVRYSIGGDNFSEQSATTKSFTGPTPPPPEETGYTSGQFLKMTGSSSLSIAGRKATFPKPTRPAKIDRTYSSASIVDGVITVYLPPDPPDGAVAQTVFYGGRSYEVDPVTGTVSFSQKGSATFMLCRGKDSEGYHGDAIYLYAVDTE